MRAKQVVLLILAAGLMAMGMGGLIIRSLQDRKPSPAAPPDAIGESAPYTIPDCAEGVNQPCLSFRCPDGAVCSNSFVLSLPPGWSVTDDGGQLCFWPHGVASQWLCFPETAKPLPKPPPPKKKKENSGEVKGPPAPSRGCPEGRDCA